MTGLNYRAVPLTTVALLVVFAALIASGARTETRARQATPAAARPVEEVVGSIAARTSATILVDSTVRGWRVEPPRGLEDRGVEQQVRAVVAQLPQGTTWVRLYLPKPAGRWDADVVTQYAVAQARLVGRRIGGPTPADSVEIMGRSVAPESARQVIAALGLARVYLVTNLASAAGGWVPASSEQREQYATRFRDLDLQSRALLMQQAMQQAEPYRAMMEALATSVPPGQAGQFKELVGGASRP